MLESLKSEVFGHDHADTTLDYQRGVNVDISAFVVNGDEEKAHETMARIEAAIAQVLCIPVEALEIIRFGSYLLGEQNPEPDDEDLQALLHDDITVASFAFKPDDRVRIRGGKFEGCEGVIDFSSLTRDGVRYTVSMTSGERTGDHLFIAEPQLALLPAHAEPHPEAAALVDETGQPENVNP